jgi:hypothetical protein
MPHRKHHLGTSPTDTLDMAKQNDQYAVNGTYEYPAIAARLSQRDG